MARHNEVRLFGCIADIPEIIKRNDTGELTRGSFHLATIKSERDDGQNRQNAVYDWPIIITYDGEMVRQMASYKMYDVIEIKGTLTTKKYLKYSFCSVCGKMNAVEGTTVFINPIFMKKRNTENLTEKQAVQWIRENRDISNSITVVGNICNEVDYFHQGKIQTSVYQIAIDRKLYLKADDPANKTDFPIVRVYGKDAKQDSMCLHKGSCVLIDGYLHTREFDRESICQDENCGQTYTWKDNTTEIIPFEGGTEYLSNYTDPKTAAENQAESVVSDFFGHGFKTKEQSSENSFGDTEE